MVVHNYTDRDGVAYDGAVLSYLFSSIPGDQHEPVIAALAETGPEALKAEPLAARLGVSKGSFYWHFRDVPAEGLCAFERTRWPPK